jgi:peptidoglycan/xylan/chitin deacetylase (PgdA/CDA1 family)
LLNLHWRYFPTPNKVKAVTLPDYFSELKPFQQHFAEGHPILCYHKISLPPEKAKIKGLYLSPQLFSQQIKEILQAGFASSPPLICQSKYPSPITITFDDGFLNNLTEAAPFLRQAGVRAINYLVADRIGQTSDWEAQEGGEADPLMNESQIREWLAAGNWIGAHTCTHPRLSRLSRKEAKEEIFSGKKKLEDRFGIPIEHFAYPYGDYNETTVELVREAGFQTACTMHRGINLPDTSPFELKRWTARYSSRTFRNFLRRFF